MIQWMFTSPLAVPIESECLTRSSERNSVAPSASSYSSNALHDLLPTVLAYLDFESIRQLSGTCRAASLSSMRAHVFERSVVQLSPSSVVVHDVLRRMALRSHLHAVEIRDCLSPPYAIRDLPELLTSVQRVKFADEPSLDREVLDEASRIGRESGVVRKMSRIEYVRHVRRRLNEEHWTMYPREFADGSPEVASELAPWLMTLNPALLVDVDLGALRIDDFRWLRRFPSLKKLQFNASSDFASDDFLEPLAHATSLEELVITRLELRDCKELAMLQSLRKLELRVAPKLRNVDFLRSLTNLERLVLTEMMVTDLSPLVHLTALRDLTLDSIASTTVILIGDDASHPSPAFPHLESIQIVFTHMPIDCLLSHSPQLTQLHLCESRLESWRPLQALNRLEQISINVDGVEDWSALAGLHHLKRLALDSRQGFVTSRHFGSGWKALEEMISPPWDDYSRLVEGPVELSTVGELRQLRSLELWNASVVTIDFLRGMDNLVELKLANPFRGGVNIINFTPLGELKKLHTLVLSGRREFKNANLNILKELPKLKNVDVSDSGVTPSFHKKLRAQYSTETLKFTSGAQGTHTMR